MNTTRVLMITSLVLLTLPQALAQQPWQTPEGRACIDRWIRNTTSRLNSYNGDTEFNSRKPWSINQYGLFVGRGIGRDSVHRGNWLMHSSLYAPTRRIDVSLRVLDSEPRALKQFVDEVGSALLN